MILAVDPGVRGALAYGHEDGRLVTVINMPSRFGPLIDTIRSLKADRIVIEDVGMAFGHEGTKSAYRFARHRGVLEMALYVALPSTVAVHWVRPQTWQAKIIPPPVQTLAQRARTGKVERDTKALAHEYATKRFFNFVFDKQADDAVCLFAYATQFKPEGNADATDQEV